MGPTALVADRQTGSKHSSAPAGQLWAYRRPRAIAIFILIIVVSLAADLITKHLAFTTLLDGRDNLAGEVQSIQEAFQRADIAPHNRAILHELHLSEPLMPGVKVTLSTNPGVVFGLPMPRAAVLAASIIVTIVVVWFFATSGAGQYWMHASLGMILAGALGNQYDRLFSVVALPGVEPIRREVRDFIDCSDLYYPYVFNVADALLVVGVAIIMLHALVNWRRSPRGNVR